MGFGRFRSGGAASGAAGGYYLYALVLHTIPTGDVPPLGGHTWVFWLSVLLSSVVAFPLHDYCLPRWYAYYLFTLYFAFIVISCLVEAFPSWQSALCSFGGPCV
mgnify:CR=1 FL=1